MNNESMTNSNIKNDKEIDNYLSEKYGLTFVYISHGDDVWSSKASSYIYANKEGDYFTVKDNSGYFADNYCSCLYDAVASEQISNDSSLNIKLYVNTKSAYFGKEKTFEGYIDYLQECPVVNIAIYTDGIDDFDKIANSLKDVFTDCSISAVIYCVESNVYDEIENYDNKLDILSSETFWIEDNKISDKSWEE